jgi:hypothetical protein
MVWAGNLALLGNLASFFLNSASGLAGSVTIAIPGILSFEARENWQQCIELIESRLALGRTINSEEDKWLYEAQEKLKSNQDTGQE